MPKRRVHIRAHAGVRLEGVHVGDLVVVEKRPFHKSLARDGDLRRLAGCDREAARKTGRAGEVGDRRRVRDGPLAKRNRLESRYAVERTRARDRHGAHARKRRVPVHRVAVQVNRVLAVRRRGRTELDVHVAVLVGEICGGAERAARQVEVRLVDAGNRAHAAAGAKFEHAARLREAHVVRALPVCDVGGRLPGLELLHREKSRRQVGVCRARVGTDEKLRGRHVDRAARHDKPLRQRVLVGCAVSASNLEVVVRARIVERSALGDFEDAFLRAVDIVGHVKTLARRDCECRAIGNLEIRPSSAD